MSIKTNFEIPRATSDVEIAKQGQRLAQDLSKNFKSVKNQLESLTTKLDSTGLPVGSIVHSMLTLSQFQALSGTGWVLADGGSCTGSTYSSVTGYNTVPDVRGTFLRGNIPSSLNSIAGSGSPSTNNATFTNHGLIRTGIKVRFSALGALTGVSLNTTYYAIVVDANTLAFATSKANAFAGTKVALGGTNSSTITQYEAPDSGSRTAAYSGGATGSNIGTMEDDGVGPHTHNMNSSNTAGGLSDRVSGSGTAGFFNSTAVLTSSGKETRPSNVAVNIFIRID